LVNTEAEQQQEDASLSALTGSAVKEPKKKMPWTVTISLAVLGLFGVLLLAERKIFRRKGGKGGNQQGEQATMSRSDHSSSFKQEYKERALESQLLDEKKQDQSLKGGKISPALKNLIDKHREKGWEDPDIKERLLRLGSWDEKTLDAHLDVSNRNPRQ